jgi:hypothetical protein
MDLPFTIKFFRKIELYQELKKEDRKWRNDNKLWNMVKAILEWTVKNHKHLYTPLSSRFVLDRLNEIKEKENEKIKNKMFNERDIIGLYEKVLGELVVRGYAESLKESG